jgi:hypothetical protein
MNIYSIEENGLLEVTNVAFTNEKEIQSIVELNLRIIFDLEFLIDTRKRGGSTR